MKKRGFTLIELLVVTAIIIVLTTIVLVNLDKARIKSRDVQRKADLSKIASALDLYKAENKVYVALTPFGDITTAIIPAQYLATIPTDPMPDATHKYQYRADSNQFKITAKSETIKDTAICDTAVITEAKLKAGDFYDPAPAKCSYFQISSSNTALTTW